MTRFNEQVYSIVDKIPCGKVMSYGQIAWMLGRPRVYPFFPTAELT